MYKVWSLWSKTYLPISEKVQLIIQKLVLQFCIESYLNLSAAIVVEFFNVSAMFNDDYNKQSELHNQWGTNIREGE